MLCLSDLFLGSLDIVAEMGLFGYWGCTVMQIYREKIGTVKVEPDSVSPLCSSIMVLFDACIGDTRPQLAHV